MKKNLIKAIFAVENLKLAKTLQLNLISNFYYKSRCCI